MCSIILKIQIYQTLRLNRDKHLQLGKSKEKVSPKKKKRSLQHDIKSRNLIKKYLIVLSTKN